MSDTVIRVENLSKRYRIGSSQRHFKYGSLRDSLANAAKAPFRSLRSSSDSANQDHGYIWALKDVSFEVKHGEVLGIIGRNGAGKTTLLKILSRITKPTEGIVRLRGRVGSLLEVGTGFHPELTGRENIYLNGAVLGMKRAEINSKFDEIVDFAEVEQFLDTSLKHYSSGMYVRLAFAVAAHLEPEILLVDEVLAGGDVAFQKKSLGKMHEVASERRTVLFVSHQLGMINTLCKETLLLDNGKLLLKGPTDRVIRRYYDIFQDQNSSNNIVRYIEDLSKNAQLLKVELRGNDHNLTNVFDVMEPIELKSEYILREPLIGISVNLVLWRRDQILFVSFETDEQPNLLEYRDSGVYTTKVKLPSPLKAGRYFIDLSIGKLNVGGIDVKKNTISFEVDEKSINTSLKSYSSKRPGLVATNLFWQTSKSD